MRNYVDFWVQVSSYETRQGGIIVGSGPFVAVGEDKDAVDTETKRLKAQTVFSWGPGYDVTFESEDPEIRYVLLDAYHVVFMMWLNQGFEQINPPLAPDPTLPFDVPGLIAEMVVKESPRGKKLPWLA